MKIQIPSTMNKRSIVRRPPLAYLHMIGAIVAALLFSVGAAPSVEAHQVLLPDEHTIKQTVRETMLGFAVAVKAEDFTLFHSRMSAQLKAQVTPQELTASFRSFIEQNIDLTRVETEEPVFTQPPFLDANGWLVVKGTYETYPHFTEFSLTYANESQEWRLVGLNIQVEPMPGSQPVPGEIPTESEVLQLVEESVLSFASAVNARDFTEFHANCAVGFQRQFSPEQFTTAFRQFSDQGIDLTVLRGHQPEFSEAPVISEDGLLVVKGRYAVAPYSVPFELNYIFEDSAWKLFGLDLNAMPLSNATTEAKDALAGTTLEELEELVSLSMMEFAIAVKAKDFSAFYAGISQMWQSQISEEELAEIFRGFIEKEIDIAQIGALKPSFITEPFVDENGVLRLEGTYPTQPSLVYFKLSYVLEDADWKLIGINVQIE